MARPRGRVDWAVVVEAVGYWAGTLFWLLAAVGLAWMILSL